MKKSIILFVFIMLQPTLPSAAQKVSFKFNDVALSEALRQIDHAQSDKHIVFMFDDLDMFMVSADLNGLSVAEAVHKVCDSHPVTVTDVGDAIFIEYVPKVVHLSPVVIYGENDAKQLSDDSISASNADLSKRQRVNNSRQVYYCSPSLTKAQPMTMPVVAPYTDIKTYQHSYIEMANSDSLTSIAHDLLSEMLDSTNLWNLKLIKVEGTEAYRSAVQQWAVACRNAETPADVKAPAEVLELMKKVDEPFMMFILQNGFERDVESHISAKDKLTSQLFVGFDYEALVADASSGQTAFYNRYQRHGDYDYIRYGVKPTSHQSTETIMRSLMKYYPDKKTYNSYQMDKQTTMLWYASIGIGSYYFNPYKYQSLGNSTGGTIETVAFHYGFLARLFQSPVLAGMGATNFTHDRTELFSFGPEVAYQWEIEKKHLFTLSLGMYYSPEGYDYRGWAGHASFMYNYRLNALNSVGFNVSAQSLLHDSSYSKSNSFIDNGLFSISYMMTIHK